MSKKDEYKYSTLNLGKNAGDDPVHFYGVIVDASFPYKTEKRSVVSCKVVDHSLAKKGTVSEKDWVTVVFYAKNFEDLPIIQRIGDIIRVHRADFQHYNDRRQLNVNLYYRGSWCLFVGDDKDEPLEPKVVNEDKEPNFFRDTPYNFSGKSFTWGDEDVTILRALRKWTKDQFKNNFVITNQTDTAAVAQAIKKSKDFDLLGKVKSSSSKDTWTNKVSIISDDGQTWQADLFKKKFPHLKAGDTVRVRSVNADNKNNLSLANHSNILQFISNSKIGNYLSKVKESAQASNIATITNKKQAGLATTALKSMFFNPKKKAGVFRAEFNVLKTQPSKPSDWTSGKGKNATTAVKLVVQDQSEPGDDKGYIIHVRDNSFFGKHKADAAKKLLVNKNNFVSAVLTREGKNYYITNTKLK